MYQLSDGSQLNDKYLITDDNSLSFKDKVFSLYDEDVIRDISRNDIPEFRHEELDNFKMLMNEISKKHLKVLVVSDYDCDGVLALTIFSRLLDYLKIEYKYYIPSRIREGYGLNMDIVKRAVDYHFDVLITIDNGVSAAKELEELKRNHIRTVVIDHHEFADRPDCDVFLHPFIFDEYYRYMCSGALCLMIQRTFMNDEYSEVLAMITVISDVMKIYGINRQLLKRGLRLFNEKRYLPLVNLSGKDAVSYDDLSFTVIPKINAISRMDHMTNVNMLARYFMDVSHDNRETARQIDKINGLRKDMSSRMCDDGMKMVNPDDRINIIADESFAEGLCGIAAGRIASKTDKPSIVLSLSEGVYKGSGRSNDAVNLYEFLKDFRGYESFGGHKKAVGLSFKEEMMTDFMTYVKERDMVEEKSLRKLIRIDMNDLTIENVKFIESLKPFGEGFNEPLFYIENPEILNMFMIKGRYPKYMLKNGIEAISFKSEMSQSGIHGFIGHLSINNYRNQTKINIGIEDIVI